MSISALAVPAIAIILMAVCYQLYLDGEL